MKKLSFIQCMIIALVIGSVFSPFAATMSLLVVLAHSLADKYLTSNISDKDRQEIVAMKVELAKVKLSQQTQDLSKAFGPR